MSVKALICRGASASLAIWSFREGLCNETPSRSRGKPKENAQNRLVCARRFFIGSLSNGVGKF